MWKNTPTHSQILSISFCAKEIVSSVLCPLVRIFKRQSLKTISSLLSFQHFRLTLFFKCSAKKNCHKLYLALVRVLLDISELHKDYIWKKTILLKRITTRTLFCPLLNAISQIVRNTSKTITLSKFVNKCKAQLEIC